MRFLFVGDCNSFLVQRLASELKRKIPDLKIDIVTKQFPPTEEAIHVFDKIGEVSNSEKLMNQPKLRFHHIYGIFQSQLETMNGIYDCCYLLYVSPVLSLLIRTIRLKAKYTVGVVFGSEYYRAGWVMRRLLKRTLLKSDYVCATNPQTLNDLQYYFGLDSKKLKITRFGLSVLNEIDTVTESECDEFRKKYQIEDEKTIALGSNSTPYQGYDELIQALKRSNINRNNFVFFFQFPDYQSNKQCKDWFHLMREEGFKCKVIDRYLSDRELAVMRSTMDIMIQVQTTDQLSGAMQEYLYAGTKVITAHWLPYEILDKAGIQYWKVTSRFEVPELIQSISETTVNGLKNKAIIGGLSKWENCIESWIIP